MNLSYINIVNLSKNEQMLLINAEKASRNSYNKYSNFYVGSSVLTTTGNFYNGTFMENISYGLTVCAEVAALLATNTEGEIYNVKTIAVVGGHRIGSNGDIVTPCGRCRQVILEAANLSKNDIKIICSNQDFSKIITTNISALLPLPFEKHF